MAQSLSALAVDLGAGSGRLWSGSWNGRDLALEELHRFDNGPIDLGNSSRWDILGLWRGVVDGLGKAAVRGLRDIASIGVDSWGLDYVLLSSSGEMLGLPHTYRDARTSGRARRFSERMPAGDLFAVTGKQAMDGNTLHQLMAHRQASPEIFEVADSFLMIADWFHRSLGGERVAEFSTATTTQLHDARNRCWANDVVAAAGLPRHILPSLVEPGTCVGRLSSELVQLTGLSRIRIVTPAAHDTASAVAAVPTTATGARSWAYVSSGTWSLIGMECDRPLLDERARRLDVTSEGGVGGTWRILRNITGLWLLTRCVQDLARRGTADGLRALLQAAAACVPWRLLIEPNDPAFQNPPDMLVAIAESCARTGQPVPASAADYVRCVLDSLAIAYADALDDLECLGGESIDTLHIVGGGARNNLLNQLAADASGRHVVAGPFEATVLGNLLVQLQALGELGGLADFRELVRRMSTLRRFDPDPANAGRAQEARARRRERLRGTR